jgi:hypothetical protein
MGENPTPISPAPQQVSAAPTPFPASLVNIVDPSRRARPERVRRGERGRLGVAFPQHPAQKDHPRHAWPLPVAANSSRMQGGRQHYR